MARNFSVWFLSLQNNPIQYSECRKEEMQKRRKVKDEPIAHIKLGSRTPVNLILTYKRGLILTLTPFTNNILHCE